MKHSLFGLLLVSFLALPAHAARIFSSDVQSIYTSHELALELTKKLRIPPPQMAFVLSLANHAGMVSSKRSANPSLAYFAGFTELYSLIYPSEREWLQKDLRPEGSDILVVRSAQAKALRAWQHVEPLYKEAAKPTQNPWPNQGYHEGGWRPTLPKFAQPLYPYWHKLPLHSGLNLESTLKQISPLPFNSVTYLRELEEVKLLGSKESSVRTQDQTVIALFWAAGGGTVTPPGMWVQIALDNLKKKRADFRAASEILNLLSQALSDAGVAAWGAKYAHSNCRPITAIEDLHKDKAWTPLLDTPPFPSWVSGHSTFSSAAAVVVDALLLNGEPLLVKSEVVPQHVRKYNSAWTAALEAGQSRIYGGIHFQDDNLDGLYLGRTIGCQLLNNAGYNVPSCSQLF